MIPDGTSLTIYSRRDVRIPERMGQLIEAGDDEGLRLLALQDRRVMQLMSGEWSAALGQTEVGAATWLPGAVVPDYYLKAPSALTIFRNSFTVEAPTQLSKILKPGMGHMDWAACTEFLNR